MEGWRKIINEILQRIAKLENNVTIEKITIPSDGYIVVKKISSDPASPVDGEIWLNTTSNTLKTSINGVIKTFTLS